MGCVPMPAGCPAQHSSPPASPEPGAWLWSPQPAENFWASEAATHPFPVPISRYLLFMKLAALQLMQQKASKIENPTSLENGSLPSSESKPEDPLGSEAGSEEEGSNASGLARVKELAETIASDDGAGGAAVGPLGGGVGEPQAYLSS